MAALIVQRPSPESDTRPPNFDKAGSSIRAAASRSSSHYAITALPAPHAASRRRAKIADALGLPPLGPGDVIDVIRIATVDHDIAGLEMGKQAGAALVDPARRDHQPDRARLLQRLDELG